jgi:hypothetical protein
LDFGQTQLRLANIFVGFFVDWGRKICGVFFCGKWGAKAKRHGKNNHFYNAKSEAGVT